MQEVVNYIILISITTVNFIQYADTVLQTVRFTDSQEMTQDEHRAIDDRQAGIA